MNGRLETSGTFLFHERKTEVSLIAAVGSNCETTEYHIHADFLTSQTVSDELTSTRRYLFLFKFRIERK